MPDLKKESDYPFDDNTLPEEWAWEFIRRNEKYKKDFKYAHKLIKPIKKKRQLEYLWSPADFPEKYPNVFIPKKRKNETVKQWQSKCVEKGKEPQIYPINRWLGKGWGLSDMYDPALNYSEGVKFVPERYWKSPRILEFWEEVQDIPVMEVVGGKIMLACDDKAIVIIDLQKPINSQLNKLKSVLNERVKELKERKLIKRLFSRNHRVHWKNYLRVFDAKSEKVPSSEIAKQIFCELTNVGGKSKGSGSQPQYHGSARVKDTYNQAKKMIESGFWGIQFDLPPEN